MKRILKSGICGVIIVSMFFTGCGSSSLINDNGGGYQQITQDIIETDESMKQLESRAETLGQQQAPDYYEQNEENKFKNLSGPMAFKIKDGHSQDTDDIESFNVEALLDDGTFLYCYSTKVGKRDENAATDNRDKIHCAAAYNYKTEEFQVFHEETSTKADEAFYMQVCGDGTGDIFIYDDGMGYLYSHKRTIKMKMEIEAFVHENFGGTSFSVTKALTGGDNRVYVNLVIEKEELSDIQEDIESDELDEKTLEVVLVYNVLNYSSSIDQEKENFDEQGKKWKKMAGTFEELPDVDKDWEQAGKDADAKWGQAFLWGLSDKPLVYQWNNKEFNYRDDGFVPNFTPKSEDSYKEFTNVYKGMIFQNHNLFIIKDEHYYELYGEVVNDFRAYNQETFKRTIKLEKSETDSSEGDSTEEVEQSIVGDKKRDTYPANCYLVGYWVLDDCDSVLNIIDNNIFTLSNGNVLWKDSEENQQSLFVGTEAIVDVVEDDGTVYLIVASDNTTYVYKWLDDTKKEMTDYTAVSNRYISEVVKRVEYSQSSVDQTYHSTYNSMTNSIDSNAGMLLNGKNFLYVELASTQAELLKQIENNDKIKVPKTYPSSSLFSRFEKSLSEASGKGYLVASLTNGILYWDKSTKKAICLDNGTWYSVWRLGDSFVAVGFENESTNYNTLDMAFARVKEFKIDELYQSGLQAILASAASVEETAAADENVKQMQEDYEKNYKNEVEFIMPDESEHFLGEWQNNKPGEVTKKELESQSESASEANLE